MPGAEPDANGPDRPPVPVISVFTPAWESGARIERAWRSLLGQEYTDWEWVIVDDSPSADTAERVQRIVRSPEAAGRVRMYRQWPTTGNVGANKATACALCLGEILVELDHDDELLPGALDLIAAAFREQPDLDFVSADWVDWIDVDEDGSGGRPGRFGDGWGFGLGGYASEMVRGERVPVALTPPVTWQTIRHIVSVPNHPRAWRASSYRAIGGHDRRFAVADDYDLLVRTFLHGTMGHIPRPLYVQHHAGATGNTSRRRNAEIQRLVGEIAEFRRADLDERCLRLGLSPTTDAPWSAEPLATATVRVDPVAARLARAGTPLVSVIIPTRGRPGPLRRAIASALAQDWPAIEVLVVGDACPDLDAVMAEIGDPRVRHANLATAASGLGATPRNYALKAMARGTLVAYLDDDNEWLPGHVASLAAPLAADPELAWSFGSFEMGGETVIARRPRRYQIDTSAIMHRDWLPRRYGYWRHPDHVDYAHDWEFVSRWGAEPWHATGQATMHYTVPPGPAGETLTRWVALVAEAERCREAGEVPPDLDAAWREMAGSPGAGDAETDGQPAPTAAVGDGETPARPRIALYGIGLNAEAVVARWVHSGRDADIVVLLDTGSTDATVERARAAGATVHERTFSPFRFDHARNHALSLVPDDIDLCVSMDMDEMLSDGWRAEVEAGWRAGLTFMRPTLEWRWADDRPPMRFTHDGRVHLRHGYHWRYPVHELLVPDDPARDVPGPVAVTIHHIRDIAEARPAYLPLLRLRAEEFPEDGESAHLLGMELRNSGSHDEALAELHRAISLPLKPNSRLHALQVIAELEPELRDILILAECAEFPHRREPWIHLADLHAKAGEWRACRLACDAALRVTRPPDDYLQGRWAWGSWPEVTAARASAELGDHARTIHHARRALQLVPGDAAMTALRERAIAASRPVSPGPGDGPDQGQARQRP